MNLIIVRTYYVNLLRTFLGHVRNNQRHNKSNLFHIKSKDISENLGATCVGFDNTSTNFGIQNSLKTSIIFYNDSIYLSGCPCRVIHNDAQKDMMIDQYWLDKSAKRKSSLSFCKFCDLDYCVIINHINTR